MYWACENHTFNATPTERLQQHPSFFQQTAPIARSFCEGSTWHHLHMLVKATLCCDWKGRAASVQTFTLWHQARINNPRRANFISACSCHMGVVHHAHPVRGESHIQHNYSLYTALLSDWLVSDSSPLAYLRERTCELDIGAFLHCKEFEDLLRAWPTVLRKLGNRWKRKGESWFHYRKVPFIGVVGIAEMWFHSA